MVENIEIAHRRTVLDRKHNQDHIEYRTDSLVYTNKN